MDTGDIADHIKNIMDEAGITAVVHNPGKRLPKGKMIRELRIITDDVPKQYQIADGREYIVLPKADIPRLADLYITWVETSTTEEACKCEWRIHPDDASIDMTLCVWCGLKEEEHPVGPHQDYEDGYVEKAECDVFKAPKRRMHRQDDHPLCPVHVKVGRVTGFFEWLFAIYDEHVHVFNGVDVDSADV